MADNLSIKPSWRHFWQTEEWAHVKSSKVWSVDKMSIGPENTLFVYNRSAPVLGKVRYMPKVAQIQPKDVEDLTKFLKQKFRTGLCMTLELDQELSTELHEAMLKNGWHQTEGVQYDETVLVDLTPSEEEIFMSFKTRSRWEIRSAERRGAVVERVEATDENMQILSDMLKVTSTRGNFTIRGPEFLKKYWQHLSKNGMGYMYFVRHEEDVLSAGFVIRTGDRAYYKDGASIRKKSDKFASRLMHWQIIQDMKKEGVKVYDMCGVMNAKHTDARNKGILTFKTGFAPVVMLQSAYTMPIGKYRYSLWQKIEPKYRKLYFKIKKDLWY